MARFSGKIGYADNVETSPGVWTDVITEVTYFGDERTNTRHEHESDDLNDDISISNQISIVADASAFGSILAIRYVEWMGERWKVSSVDVQRPRLLLTLGGVYNGPTPNSSSP